MIKLGLVLSLRSYALQLGAQVDMHLALRDIQDHTSRAVQELDRQRDELDRQAATPKASEKNVPWQASGIPPRPQYFYGRGAQAAAVVDQLSGPNAGRVAILGGPGMGKTSLALNVLHDPAVVQKFGTSVYFIACDAAEAGTDLLSIVAHHFGIPTAMRPGLQKALLAKLQSNGHTLITLDNFESAWDATSRRVEAEAVLALLAGLDNVAFIITMRGGERPSSVSWTKPVVPLLEPLDRIAAKHTFLAISDGSELDEHLDPLLEHLANVPLAVVLMANLAQYESYESLLWRWKETRTSMLTRGDNRLSSLDMSIALSLNAQRMRDVPAAARLLGLLALLPDGLMDTDVHLCGKAIPQVSRGMSALLQNALATRSLDQRIQVLAPIREHVLLHHPPAEEDTGPLFDHYFTIADQLLQVGLPSSADAIASVAPELGNLESTIRYCFAHDMHVRKAFTATMRICRLITTGGKGPYALVTYAEDYSRSRRPEYDDALAEIIYWRSAMVHGTLAGGKQMALVLLEESLEIHKKLDNRDGIIDATNQLLPHWPLDRSIVAASEARLLSTERSDWKRLGQTEVGLARCYLSDSNKSEAKASYLRAIIAFKKMPIPEPRYTGYLLYSLAEVAVGQGDVVGAMSQLREALPLLRQANYVLGAGNCERLLGVILRQQGHLRAAIQHLNTAIIDFEASGHQINLGFSAFEQVRAYLLLGEIAEATTTFDRVAAIVKKAGNMWASGPSITLQGRGYIAMYYGDLEEAQLAFEGAAEDVARHGPPGMVYYLEAIRGLAEVHKLQGTLDKARNYLVICAVGQRKLQDAPSVVKALAALAEVLDDEAAQVLVDATMLPLLRFGLQSDLADLLLFSAMRAKVADMLPLARHRAAAAVGHYKVVGSERGLRTPSELLDDQV